MSVIKYELDRLNGSVEIENKKNKGVKFIFNVGDV